MSEYIAHLEKRANKSEVIRHYHKPDSHGDGDARNKASLAVIPGAEPSRVSPVREYPIAPIRRTKETSADDLSRLIGRGN